ncbi:hypothetical protein J4E91_008327 [Alternaria rosae]|nr:hypothetical protein J4E91_008327 [Alternaria rosae]
MSPAHPSLIVTVLLAVVAGNRELQRQLALLSAGKDLMQGAMSELQRENEAVRSEKDQSKFAGLDKQLTEATELKLDADEAAKYNVTMLRRALTAENALQHEQKMHHITEGALRMEIRKNRIKSPSESAMNPPQKRGHDSLDIPSKPTKKAKRATAVYIECYKSKTNKKCGGTSTCWPCQYLEKECKRMKCKYFTAGTCRIANCTLAHSDSGFPEGSLEPFQHVPQPTEAAPVVPPKPST